MMEATQDRLRHDPSIGAGQAILFIFAWDALTESLMGA
jgi:hypothetical protein